MNSATPDNANPVIHTASARRTRHRSNSLDLSDDDEWDRKGRLNRAGSEDEDSTWADPHSELAQFDLIDQDEIFGE